MDSFSPTDPPHRPETVEEGPVAELLRAWQEGRQPQLEALIAEYPSISRGELAALVQVDIDVRWRRNDAKSAESYLARFPALSHDPELAVDIIYAEYQQRFPAFAEELSKQIGLHRALETVDDRADAEGSGSERPGASLFESPANLPELDASYEIVEEIGRGGMGVVYKARQVALNRFVALKMVRSVDATNQELLARFRSEARAVASLRHPNIVQVYDFGEQDGLPFLAMELIEGGTLAPRLHGNPWPARAAAELMIKLARAVQFAHDHHVIHRDLKPANVLIASEKEGLDVKITDFGLGKFFHDETSPHTKTGAFLGTPSYMAPEQASGRTQEVGPATDIYSLGAILYELLTGLPPFLGATILDTLTTIRERDPIPPRSLQPRIPRDLETICLKCLSKSPHARYRTGEELADDLGRFLAGRTIRARRPAVFERFVRWSRRNPVVATLTGCLLLTGVIGFSGVVWQWRQAEHARNSESVAHRDADERAREASQGLERLKLANGFLERGEGYLLARRWDDALASFTRAIELRPDHVQVWEARGELLYVRLGLWDLATQDVRRAFELQPPRLPERWWWNALLRLHEGDLAGYRALCTQFRERQSQNRSADFAYYLIFALGLSPANQDSAAKLVVLADALVPIIPNPSAACHVQGLALLRAGQARGAIERCRQSLATDANGFCRELNYPVLALAHHQLGEDSQARAAFDQAVQAMRQWTSQRCDPGTDSWVSTFGATGVWPISTWDWLQCETLIREARTALGLDPIDDDPRGLLLRARAFAGLRRFEEADGVFQSALQKLPQDQQLRLEAHRNRAYCFALRQKYAEAADEFGLASALSPGDCRLLGFLSLMQCASGQIEPYRKTCARLVKSFGQTEDRAVANYVVRACVLHPQSLADVQTLMPLAERAKATYFGSVRVLGTANYRAGRYREAIDCFDQASRISPLKPWDLAFFAMAHFRLGHRQDALRILDSAQQWIERANTPDPDDLSGANPAWEGWHERVEVPLVVSEARTLIESAPVSAEAGSSPGRKRG